MKSMEPWRRFEVKVDPESSLPEAERSRRAKISYRASLRAAAKKGAKTRAATKARKDSALKRWLETHPTAEEVAAFARERDNEIRAQILWAAAQRGTAGIDALRRRQRKVRTDCLLCGGPFQV